MQSLPLQLSYIFWNKTKLWHAMEPAIVTILSI